MKEVKVARESLITKEVTTYIADDGKEFSSKSDCEMYERDCAYKLLSKKHYNDYPKAQGWPPYTSFYCTDDYLFLWMRIADENDIELIKKCTVEIYSEIKIGDIVCIETGYDGERWCYSAESTFIDMSSFLRNFGYGVVELK